MKLGFWQGNRPTLKLGSALANQQYWQKIRALNPIAYWPLWDVAGASSAVELMGVGNGAPVAVTFGVAGIGDGKTAASFNGSTSRVNAYTAAFSSAFSGATGAIALWAKVSGAGVWTDGVLRCFDYISVDANNRVFWRRPATDYQIDAYYVAGGTLKYVNLTGLTSTDWYQFAITWSKPADEFKAFVNGTQIGTTVTGLGTWAGSLSSSLVTIGRDADPANTWSGSIAHVAVWDKVITPTEVLRIYTANP